jgi:hypothetical protein
MPTLNWIGKATVVKHHKEVPFRLLELVAKLSCSPYPQAREWAMWKLNERLAA